MAAVARRLIGEIVIGSRNACGSDRPPSKWPFVTDPGCPRNAPATVGMFKSVAMNYTLGAGKSVTFQYRVIITSGTVDPMSVEAQSKGFLGK